MDYLEYAYLQSGRVAKAKAVFDEMNSLPSISGLTLTGDYALAAIPARYTIELGSWEQASQLAARERRRAVGSGDHLGGNRRRQRARRRVSNGRIRRNRNWPLFATPSRFKNNSYWANQVEVQRREVAAWIAEQRGKPADALATGALGGRTRREHG